jgi:hypothetical protein
MGREKWEKWRRNGDAPEKWRNGEKCGEIGEIGNW